MKTTNQFTHIPMQSYAPNTWYHESAHKPEILANDITSDTHYDVAIIGAGFTGISAALRLAQAGVKVAVFEANSIGQGASGRNGGLVCTGFRHDQKWFETKMGVSAADDLWQLAEAAKTHLRQIITAHNIKADLEYGLVCAAHTPRQLDVLHADAGHLLAKYDYSKIGIIEKAELSDALGTDVYYGGTIDKGAGRLHPLKLLYGLADASQKAGARIFENCRVNQINETSQKVALLTQNGEISADRIILAGDGYLEGIDNQIEAKVMPIYSFVIATEPLIENKIMKGAVAASDTRFVLNYFQRTIDNRLIFGGGEKYSTAWPKDIAAFVAKNMHAIFPQLRSAEITHSWGGALGITPTRLPLVRQQSPRVLVCAGYSGQGVLLAPFFGAIMGEMLLGDSTRFSKIDKMPVPTFPGGRAMRFPLLSAAMSYYSILDKLP